MPGEGYAGGYPTADQSRRVHDEIDLYRAVQSYRLFFPSVSGKMIFKGNTDLGVVPNRVFGMLQTQPRHVGLTLNSDTPYTAILLDVSDGPIVIELPPGPLICVAMDVNQRWIHDMGLPGPDAGKGGKHLILPPDHTGEVPDGYFVGRSTSSRLIAAVRSLPVGGDVEAATERMTTVKVSPLNPTPAWTAPEFIDLTSGPQDTSPNSVETSIEFWRVLHGIVDAEPALPLFRLAYGELAALGIQKGQPFAPDERMTRILTQAAEIGAEQLRVESFADRRDDRIVWPGRYWEWAALRYENGDFELPDSVDIEARDKWFYQAIGASPAMFRRDTQAGSLYWLGLRDATGTYLDGSRSYKLTVTLPVPARLFWSVTAYDAQTRSQIQNDRGHSILSSLFDLTDLQEGSVDLYFGPTAPEGHEDRWIQTQPDHGWFVYFRIYGPDSGAFDHSWSLPDFEAI